MSFAANFARVVNCQPVALAAVPEHPVKRFTELLAEQLSVPGTVLSALYGALDDQQEIRLYAVVSEATTGSIMLMATRVSDSYPAVTPECSQAHWFEREIAEQWGVVPEGHPWLKPIRFHRSYRPGHDAWGRSASDELLPCVQPAGVDYFKVMGEEVHEVAVGPVHAGVIEPGHFRFQCHGEHVFTLEIELGYQHRGVERRLVGGPDKRTIHYMETLSGDTSVGHATAYCQLCEGLAGVQAPVRALAVRSIALELERLANHTGDLGALAGDVGYQPTQSFCGRLRGDFLNATALLCGSRFGRGLVRPGGIAYDLDDVAARQLLDRVSTAQREVSGAANLMWNSSGVLARFEGTGVVTLDTVQAMGVVGVAGRASGFDRDVRRDFPSGYSQYAQIPVSTWHTGDVFARAYVRHLEVQNSCDFICEQLPQILPGAFRQPIGPLRGNSLTVSMVEGWRGEICHVAITDDDGRFAHYKVVDPSFHNWVGLAMALRDQQISDFPLCNKSFNLSYCGHDL
jgi:Ni,Fe-hydrogenase III large subunit